MNTDKLEVLQEMYSLCIQNRKEEKKKIQTNLDRISEIDAYIKSIKESEEADFKIFSPRSSESIYGDRIRKAEEEKEEIENEINSLWELFEIAINYADNNTNENRHGSRRRKRRNRK